MGTRGYRIAIGAGSSPPNLRRLRGAQGDPDVQVTQGTFTPFSGRANTCSETVTE